MLPILRILCLAELVTLLGCSLAFVSFAFRTSELCYSSPCMAEHVPGHQLWKVSEGLAFATMITSLALVAFPLYGLWLAKQHSPLIVAAGFMGGGLGAGLLTMIMIGLWRSTFMILHDTSSEFRLGGNTYELNHEARAIARGLTSSAIGYFCVTAALILPIMFKPHLFQSDDDYQEVPQDEQPSSRSRSNEIEMKSVGYGSVPPRQSSV